MRQRLLRGYASCHSSSTCAPRDFVADTSATRRDNPGRRWHDHEAGRLKTFEAGKSDLLLCDLRLPDGTGIDLIRKVRETRQTPAIALTGFGMQEDVDRAQKAGFDAHLTKPVNLQKLEAAMWRLLQDRP